MSEVPYIRMCDTSAYTLSLSLLEDEEMVALEDSINPPVVAVSGDDLDETMTDTIKLVRLSLESNIRKRPPSLVYKARIHRLYP